MNETRSTLMVEVSVKSMDMSFHVVELSRLNSCTTSNTDPLLAIASLSAATCGITTTVLLLFIVYITSYSYTGR